MKMPNQVNWRFGVTEPTKSALQWVWSEIAKYFNGPFQPLYLELDTLGLTTFPDIAEESMVVLKDLGTGNFYFVYRDNTGTYHTSLMT